MEVGALGTGADATGVAPELSTEVFPAESLLAG